MNRSLVALALSSFVVATDGTLVVGLLNKISADVHSSVAVAGQAVAVFAIGYAVGGPTLIAATRRWRPGRVLVVGLVLFIAANVATGLARSVLALLVARAVAGAAAGIQTPTAAALAGAVSSEASRGRGLAVVVGAASAASVIGVPLGTLVGASVGWRAAFFVVAGAAALLLVVVCRRSWPPTEPPRASRSRLGRSGSQTALILATTLLWAAGSFTFFSYFAVVVGATAGVSTAGLAIYLFVFGVAGVCGALVSGWATDARGPLVVIAAALVTMVAALLALAALSSERPTRPMAIFAAGLLVGVYGLGTWAVTPPQQHRLLGCGGDRRLLLSFNASALYGGVAFGAAFGGALLGAGAGAAALCVVAAAIELAALAVFGLSTRSSAGRANGGLTAR